MAHIKNYLVTIGLILLFTILSSYSFAQEPSRCQSNEQPSIEEYSNLSALIAAHSRRYYLGEPTTISAYQYDALVMRIKRWEACFPELTDNGYLTRVQGEEGYLPKRLHKMRSLQKTYQPQEVRVFMGDIYGEYPATDFLIQPKIDGMAIELSYRDGHLIDAATRGNGWRGESVFQQAQRMSHLPMLVEDYWESLTVRGELYADASCAAPFIRNASSQQKFAKYADLRQFTVATILSHSPELVQVGCLRFVAYEWLECNLANDSECLRALEQLGIPTLLEHTAVVSIDQSDQVDAWYKRFQSSIEDYGFATDGVVIKANALAVRKILGATEKAPHWAIALKYQQVSAISEVIDIHVSYGRTGKVTPILHIKPITLAGRTIKKLTGHSMSFMRKHQLGIGSHIEVQLQGGTVPMFQQTHIPADSIWQFAHSVSPLPLCLSLRVKQSELDEDCQGRLIKQIAHFVSKKGISVSGLGEKSIQRLIQAGVLQRVSDIFMLPPEALTAHLGWNKKKAKMFVLSVTNRRLLPFEQQLLAIGIPKFSHRDIEILAQHYNSLHELIAADIQELPLSTKKRKVLNRLLNDKITKEELVALAKLFAVKLHT